MEMIFNHMPAEYYADKKISANAKLVLQRLFTLSKDGTQPVYAQRKFLANELGLSVRTISNVFKELEIENYIQETENTNSFDRTRNFILTCKSCKIDTKQGEKVAMKEEKVARVKGKSCKGGIAKVATSSLDRSKDRSIARKERDDHSLSFDFNSLFYAMNEIKNEFTDHIFTDAEIRENAQSYLDKSQEYKFYKGKVTRNKLKLWLKNSIDHNQKEISAQHTPITLAGLQDNKAVNDFEQLKKQILEQENQNLKKDDPIEADFEIIDEHDQNKNAPA